MAKKEPPTYYFETVSDMQLVPLEKLDAFTTDLRLWLQAHRIVELKAEGALTFTTPTDVFGWIDDGKHNVRVKVSMPKRRRASPPSVAAVDPQAADPGNPSTREKGI